MLAGDHQPGRDPHVNGIGALWVDGAFWFETGEQSRKAKNLARDPRCTLSVATQEFDLVVDGDAHQVTEPATVAAMAERWAAEGWPAHVDETGRALTAEFSAPSAGPPPWFVYRLTPRRATALATIDPGGATRWTFDDSRDLGSGAPPGRSSGRHDGAGGRAVTTTRGPPPPRSALPRLPGPARPHARAAVDGARRDDEPGPSVRRA